MNPALSQPTADVARPIRLASAREAIGPFEGLHRTLLQADSPCGAVDLAGDFIDACLTEARDLPSELPDRPDALLDWMDGGARHATQRYEDYMAARSDGAPRRFFTNRAHALHFLRMVAPTKLVDGAWLWGLMRHADNPRFAPLVRTYLEELGHGDPAKNHVLLYQDLLRSLGLEQERARPDEAWQQGAIQLALGLGARRFLPEIVGFNLAYEQLPLHLLITAYELDELGIDPYYFTLHVTVDNAGSGHARQACDATLELLPRHGDAASFWERAREGSKLGGMGLGTEAIIAGFDIRDEVVRILSDKAPVGAGAHAQHCRLAGRSINDWLRSPGSMTAFLDELETSGLVRLSEPPQASRFWQLLHGDRAQMFGVFTPYELQVIHDWIRGPASADGLPYTEVASNQARRRPRFHAAERHRARSAPATRTIDVLDPDLESFRGQYANASAEVRRDLLIRALAPHNHWTPAGLHATRLAGRQLTR